MGTMLYVGNLPFDICEADIRELFAKVGTVADCTLIVDKFTNQSCGFAFVEMASKDDATKAAAEYNGQDFKGRPMTIGERLFAIRPWSACAGDLCDSEQVRAPADLAADGDYRFLRELIFISPAGGAIVGPDGAGRIIPAESGWIRLPYCRGDQSSAHYICAETGKEIKGCGGGTPYIRENGEWSTPFLDYLDELAADEAAAESAAAAAIEGDDDEE